MRIAYVLDSKFPTKRAYGVTTLETVSDLLSKGHIVKIFCQSSTYSNTDFVGLKQTIWNFKLTLGLRFLLKLSFLPIYKLKYIFWTLLILKNLQNSLKEIINFNPEIIWVRSPLIAYFYARKIKNCNIVLEIHGTQYQNYLQRLIPYKSQILFCPINPLNLEFLQKFIPDFNSIVSPMSINLKSISCHKNIKDFTNSIASKDKRIIHIGYIGKFESTGFSKGVDELIRLSKLSAQLNKGFKISLIGAEPSELLTYSKKINKINHQGGNINIFGHLPHSEALLIMQKFDILVVPTYQSIEYIGMPLKILEYCAAGRIIIAAEIPLFRKLFTGSFQPFWYKSGDIYSMLNAIENSLVCDDLENRIMQGINFASEFTWEKRNSKILEYFSNSSVW